MNPRDPSMFRRKLVIAGAIAVFSFPLLTGSAFSDDAATVRVVGRSLSAKQANAVGEALSKAGFTVLPALTPEVAGALAVGDLVGEDAPGVSAMTDADYVYFAEDLSAEHDDLIRVSWIDSRRGEVEVVRVMDVDDIKDDTDKILAIWRQRLAKPEVSGQGTAEAVAVTVRVRGHAKAGASGRAARLVALLDAKRLAVEHAMGAVVEVEQLPDAKNVTAKAVGGLKYKVVEEGTDDVGPYIDVIASLDVPRSLVEKAPRQDLYPTETGGQPYVNKSDAGQIDWERGTVTAIGVANGQDVLARRAALADAYGAAIVLVRGIAVNSEMRAGEAMSQSSEVAQKVDGLVREAEIVSAQADAGKTTVEIRVPLWGVRGIQQALHDFGSERDEAGAANESEDSDDPTGIVIDASGTHIRPAILPRFQDSEGTILFDAAKDADPEAIRAHGAAAYVVAPAEKGENRNGWPVWKASVGPDGTIVLASNETGVLSDAGMLFADSSRSKDGETGTPRAPRRRQGSRPVQLGGSAAKGRLPSNIVVSAKQQDKAQLEATLRRLFRKGKVVIYMDTAIGGVEGLIPVTTQPLQAKR